MGEVKAVTTEWMGVETYNLKCSCVCSQCLLFSKLDLVGFCRTRTKQRLCVGRIQDEPRLLDLGKPPMPKYVSDSQNWMLPTL